MLVNKILAAVVLFAIDRHFTYGDSLAIITRFFVPLRDAARHIGQRALGLVSLQLFTLSLLGRGGQLDFFHFLLKDRRFWLWFGLVRAIRILIA